VFQLHSTDGNARRATLRVAHGAVETPAFMPVGTAGSVKGLDPGELREARIQVVLTNAYHLWLRPGRDVIVEAGGLHRFMGWSGPILMDSGGFQIFSLEARRVLDEDGVTFSSHLDGRRHRFTPETVVAFAEAIGVDVAMVLDVCVRLPAPPEAIAESVRLTSAWAARSARARSKAQTQIFGIVQGGLDERARERSACDVVALDFAGYAIGGLSVGESRCEMERLARFTAQLLPESKPRYLMGVGTIRDLIAAIDCGIDLFDCVYPTRCGRNGRAMTRTGDFHIRNAAYVRDFSPIDARCECPVCATFSRAYLSHLFRSGEMLGPRLLSYHNIWLLAELMEQSREAIGRGSWEKFRDAALQTQAA